MEVGDASNIRSCATWCVFNYKKNLSKGRSEFIQHESYIPTHNYRIRFNFTNIKLISDIFKVIVIMSR